MSKKNSVLGAVVWSAAQSWGSSLFAFVVAIVLARLLQPEAFGLVAMATVYVHFVNIFVEQGLGEAVIQREEVEPEHLDSAFWISLGASVLLVVVSIAAADLIAGLFRERELAPVVGWLSLNLLFSGLQAVQKAILKRELRFAELAARSLIANFVGGAAGVVAAFSGLGVWSLVIQTVGTQAISAALLWHIADWAPGFRVSFRHFRDLFGFSANVFGSNILTFANRHVDDLLIGMFLGPTPLGYYTIAYEIVGKATTLLVSVINRVAFPVFSRYQGDQEKMRAGFYKATRYTSLLAFPAFLGVFAIAPDFITTAYGAKWAPSIPVLRVLTFMGIFSAVFNFNGSVLMAAGKANWRLWLIALYAVAATIAFAVTLRWGILAVAAAYVGSRYLLSPVPLWMISRVLRFDPWDYLRQFAVPLLGSSLMVASVLTVKPLLAPHLSDIVALGAYILTGVLVYAGFLAVAARDTARQVLAKARDAASRAREAAA